jgi:HPt (histidine-containing phosphotransfer) domain-containing protein
MRESVEEIDLKTSIDQILLGTLNTRDPYSNLRFEQVFDQQNQNARLKIMNPLNELLDTVETPIEFDDLRKALLFWCKDFSVEDFIDIETLKKLTETIEKAQTLKIFDSFVLSTEKKLELINQALKTKNYQHLQECTHYVKTSAGIVGANYLFSFCELALTKCRKKESWTFFFEQRFQEMQNGFQSAVVYSRSRCNDF